MSKIRLRHKSAFFQSKLVVFAYKIDHILIKLKLYSDLSNDQMVKISPISADKIGIVFKL